MEKRMDNISASITWRGFVIMMVFFFCSGSCSLEMAGIEGFKGSNKCSNDSDCVSENSFCDMELGVCVSKVNNQGPLNFLLEIIPSDYGDKSSSLSQYFLFDVNQGAEIPFITYTLSDYAELKGNVKWTDNDYKGICSKLDRFGNCIVDAKVELIPEGEFPETMRQVITVNASSSTVKDIDIDGGFDLIVAPGKYSIKVTPLPPFDAYLPPYRAIDPETLGATFDLSGNKTISIGYEYLPESCGNGNLRIIDGKIERSSGMEIGVDIVVWAANPSTGDRISSRAYIGADNNIVPSGGFLNSFRLYMPPKEAESNDDEFVIVVSSKDEIPQIPTMKFGPFSFSYLDVLNSNDGSTDNCAEFGNRENFPEASLTIPTLGPRIQFTGSVEGIVENDNFQPIEGAKVRFYTESVLEGGVNRTYEISATTDSTGQIVDSAGNSGVYLVSGFYSVYIYPPLGSEFQAEKFSSILIEDTPVIGKVFQLNRRKGISGTITRKGKSETLSNVIVEANPVTTIELSDTSNVIPRYSSTWSDSFGLFSILIDEGIYDIVFKPPQGSNLPWVWYDSVSASQILERYSDPSSPWDVQIPDPVVLKGEVKDSSGSFVESSVVKIYRVIYSPEPEEPPRVRQIAETSTSTDGTFNAFITLSNSSID